MDQQKKKKRDLYPLVIAFLAGVSVTLLTAIGGILLIRYHWPEGAMRTPVGIFASEKTRAIVNLIDEVYVGEIEEEKMADAMYRGLISGLGDRYSTYYTEEEYKSIRESQLGHYKGIGITVSLEGDYLRVEGVSEGSSAEEAGLLAGDRILAIDGEEVAGKTLDQAISLIRESQKEETELLISREGEEEAFSVCVTLSELDSISVASTLLEDTIGYIRIKNFTALTPDQFQEALEDMKGQGAKKLIVDLRNNPGGLLSAVCDTLRLILPKGLIVYTLDKKGVQHDYDCEGETPLELPLVVLVNSNSASASEIFTGAVQDYEIGTIVGTKTFGKGIVQDAFTFPDHSVVRLTISHYYTPLGKDIHGVGITPDVIVELPSDAEEDLQLKKAIEILEKSEF